MSSDRKLSFSRRNFLRAGTAAGIGILGGSLLKFEHLARAAGEDDHFFLFIELKGGIAWHYATDARDLASLPLEDAKVVKKVELLADGTTPPLTMEQQEQVLKGPGGRSNHGNVIILPYVGSLEESYKKGTTNAGSAWTLGLSGHSLQPHINDIALVRGVRSIHNFHGGANDEAWSGLFSDRSDSKRKHMAGTVAAHLAAQKGAKLLDNVVFEGATFPGTSAADFLTPMRIDVRSLGVLAAAQQPGSARSAEARFAHARQLSDAIGNSRQLGPQHKDAFAAYLAALEKAPAVQKRLADMADRLGSTDASLDLDLQVDTALTLFDSGLTRVATLCLGSNNGRNNVDGFGLFDAHYGLVHKAPEGTSRQRTYGHHLNVEQAMKSIARLIGLLKSTQRNGKSMFEQTTVIVSSEFSRPSNSSGNEDNSGMFGAGHYNYNNNVMMFGKGVKGGAWVGKNDPVTQYAHLVDVASLDQPDPTALTYSTPDFFTLNADTNTWTVPNDGRIEGLAAEAGIQFVGGAKRPIMPKDILKTVYAIAKLDEKFGPTYTGNWFSDARTIRSLVK
jgi:hypothetical protein